MLVTKEGVNDIPGAIKLGGQYVFIYKCVINVSLNTFSRLFSCLFHTISPPAVTAEYCIFCMHVYVTLCCDTGLGVMIKTCQGS